MITNDVSDYINLLVRIAHIICNHPLFWSIVTGMGTELPRVSHFIYLSDNTINWL